MSQLVLGKDDVLHINIVPEEDFSNADKQTVESNFY